jgi:tRNA-Thr(GGU) m(6)t(6)A37 methyltransferase TsaA
MNLSRRTFLTKSAVAAGAAGAMELLAGRAIGGEPVPAEAEPCFKVFPVGRVEVKGTSVRIVVFEKYAGALLGLDGWSHVNVFYWFDKNDVPHKRGILQVHPRDDAKNPLTGVFACRSPVRPNLIALSVCRIVAVEGRAVTVEKIDAFDGTPVVDLKPFIPPDEPRTGVRVPDWAKRGP